MLPSRFRNGSFGVWAMLGLAFVAMAWSVSPPARAAPSRVVNFSVRGPTGAGDSSLIAGFVVPDGAGARPIIVRAVGPTLSQAPYSVPGVDRDPRLAVFQGNLLTADNDNWGGTADLEKAFASIGAFPLQTTALDAALQLHLEPGAYTATVSGLDEGKSVVLLEVYDADRETAVPLANLSLRAALTDRQPSITGGFVVLGDSSRKILLRVAGPALQTFGVGSASLDPRLELRKDGVLIAANDNWDAGSSALGVAMAASGAFPFVTGSKDAAVLPTLAPGSYTVDVTADQGKRGVVLIELYDAGGASSAPSTPGVTGWLGEYFNNKERSGTPVVTRMDPAISFNWGEGSPDPKIRNDGFSARWTALLTAPETGDYVFVGRADTGFRLWVNDRLLIDEFDVKSIADHYGTVRLEAGVSYPVRMEFYESDGRAQAHLEWLAGGVGREVVPAALLSPGLERAPSVTSSRRFVAVVGAPFDVKLTASSSPDRFSVSTLPAGLTLDAKTGRIQGTPTTPGVTAVLVSASNAHGTGEATLLFDVVAGGGGLTREYWRTKPANPGNAGEATGSRNVAQINATSAEAGAAFERWTGWLVAPTTGAYHFSLAAGGPAELWMADSAEPADAMLRARVTSATGRADWSGGNSSRRAAIFLKAGERHYIEVRADASAHVSLAWKLPGAAASAGFELVPSYAFMPESGLEGSDAEPETYTATLRPPGGIQSGASGTALLSLNPATRVAQIALDVGGLSSPITSAYIYLGRAGETGPALRSLPASGSEALAWTLTARGGHDVDALLEALRTGGFYAEIQTAGVPTGELRGQFVLNAGGRSFSPPVPPPALPGGKLGSAGAARLLTQATFGPTRAEIDRVADMTAKAWLEEQWSKPPTYELPFVDRERAALQAVRGPSVDLKTDTRIEAWWEAVLHGEDQLRQRVAFALSEIFVVSDDNGPLRNRVDGPTHYYDMLVRNASGNFRELLEEVTLHPAMGNFLSMLRNAKPDPLHGIYPDENFAREVMQLFTIGLYKLRPDGTLERDFAGLPIPTYSQSTVENMARVFTGWTYAPVGSGTTFTYGTASWREPMFLYESQHDRGEKVIFDGIVLPAGVGGREELKHVLDLLVQHPNTAPFISKQLIQRLVTSNPSAGYVYRVAQVFADNGQGVRGDLKAVVNAILTDYEARSETMVTQPTFGKLREPILRLTAMWRAFDAYTEKGQNYRYWNPEVRFFQGPLRSPTVFNFFEPDYVQPGRIANAGLVAPEFQITTESTVEETSNELEKGVYSGMSYVGQRIYLDLADEIALAGDPAALVQHLNLLLLSGQISDGLRDLLLQTLNKIPADRGADLATTRARTAVHLIVVSPEFAVQR